MPDLPAFIAIRTAVGSAEETTQGLRRSLPAAERSEAIRKIVDALSRHLSGKEVLSKDALVKLVEDLALILKFPPLPQETGRAFIRRLTGFIEALPMPERLLLEKQLATRSLVQRVAVAATIAGDRRGAVPPDRTPLRSLPLPAQVPPVLPGAKRPVPSDLALLQAMLKKTYGADMEDVRIETTPKGAAIEAAQEEAPAGPQRSPKAPTNAPAAPRGAEIAARDASASPLEGEMAEMADTAAMTPEGSDEQLPDSEADLAEPSAPRRSQAAGLNGSALALPKDAKPATAEGKAAVAEAGAESLPDGEGPEGTDGPSRSAREDDRPRVRTQSAARMAQPPAEALRAVIRDSLALPGTSKSWQPRDMEDAGPAAPLLPPENEAPARPRETAGAVRSAAAASEPPVDAASDTGTDASLPDLPPPQAERRTGEDAMASQGLARVPESGLPREMFPFALVPYPPAEESDADEVDRRKRESEGEPEKDARDDEGEGESDDQQQGHAAGGEQDRAEDRPAADAYDLYRKLGGLA
ncbi:hypothetical protein GHK78_32515 [Sinorhizobium meliloti]|uniref:hypothetical protein n=1 Tax=Rhizobium meliloti TaxID=382 RepID=UPI0002F790C0|nr:hypothetical protein [Sinorhizobium meliloti]MDE3872750.1 hypothetical protein [Sinorhizobium meliloti]MQX67636.1 hypothetical protein [Sinorhizobium meliloti]